MMVVALMVIMILSHIISIIDENYDNDHNLRWYPVNTDIVLDEKSPLWLWLVSLLCRTLRWRVVSDLAKRVLFWHPSENTLTVNVSSLVFSFTHPSRLGWASQDKKDSLSDWFCMLIQLG